MKITQHDKCSKLTVSVKKAITKYLTIKDNDSEFCNPSVMIMDEVYSVRDVLKKRKIRKGYQIPALVGSHGIFAKQEIPRFTVLGEYGGYQAIQKEWVEMFDDTNEEMEHSAYKFGFDLDEGTEDETRKIIIDPIEANMHKGDNPMLLLYINDIRKNVEIRKASDEDRKRENCRFFTVRVNGWPRVFVITTRKILYRKQLLMDYGEGYNQYFDDKSRYQRIMNCKRCISDNIKNKTIAGLELDGEYQLE